jgi:hypothetical protein
MPYGSSLPEFETSGITFNSPSTLPPYRGRDIGLDTREDPLTRPRAARPEPPKLAALFKKLAYAAAINSTGPVIRAPTRAILSSRRERAGS